VNREPTLVTDTRPQPRYLMDACVEWICNYFTTASSPLIPFEQFPQSYTFPCPSSAPLYAQSISACPFKMPPFLSSKPLHLRKAEELQKSPASGQPYSIALPNSETQGRSRVYRHWRYTAGLLETLDPSVRTAHDMFETSARRTPKAPCLGYRPYDSTKHAFGPYEWMDYVTVQKRRANLGVGLVELHAREGVTGTQYGIGLWCQNRPEWQITDLACMSQ